MMVVKSFILEALGLVVHLNLNEAASERVRWRERFVCKCKKKLNDKEIQIALQLLHAVNKLARLCHRFLLNELA